VEKRLGELAGKFGRDKIAADVVQIDTHPRKQ
jgi:eukaryotic-like serine/threonine-protein kinase